jgi:hypothetical protein
VNNLREPSTIEDATQSSKTGNSDPQDIISDEGTTKPVMERQNYKMVLLQRLRVMKLHWIQFQSCHNGVEGNATFSMCVSAKQFFNRPMVVL